MENRTLPKLDLNVTNKCNLRCTHCAFNSGTHRMPELSLNRLETILKETKELGGKRFDITGGEPLTRKDMPEIISIGNKLGYRIELVTNGTMLDSERLREFKQLGLNQIAISLDGSIPEIYNRIRRSNKETFYKVIENIRKCKEFGFYTKINTLVSSLNLENLADISELALKLDADEQGFYYFTPVGRGHDKYDLMVDPIKWLSYVRTKLKPYSEKGMKIGVEIPLREIDLEQSEKGCVANSERSHLQILPDGNVYPCAIMAAYEKPLANLNTHSIKDVWKNEKLWAEYWASISPIFDICKRHCVKIPGSEEKSQNERYEAVCPLRKWETFEV